MREKETLSIHGYDNEYPFAVYITNLKKYNEGELVGAWVNFPTNADEINKVFHQIGIGQKNIFGDTYEEWFVSDYDCYIDGLYDKLSEYPNLDELNYLANQLYAMNDQEYAQFQAAMELGDHSSSVCDLINLTENLDCYDLYPDIQNTEELGRYYINEFHKEEIPSWLEFYIDYDSYGQEIYKEELNAFTQNGYIRNNGSSFIEVYDGRYEDIPLDYCVSENIEKNSKEVDLSQR